MQTANYSLLKVRDSYINDDLADEVEAIRLAADFSSRRLLSEQRRDRRDSGVTAASASRLRIRSLLDKQKTVRVSLIFYQLCSFNLHKYHILILI